MCSIIPHDNLIVARVVKKSPIVRGIQMFLLYLNLRNKTNKSSSTKYVLSHNINYPDDINYPDNGRKSNLN